MITLTEMFNIRPIQDSDVPFLWEMLYQAIYTPAGKEPPPRDILNKPEIAGYVSGWGRKGDSGFIALSHDGQLIGAVWIRLFGEANQAYGYVDDETPELSMAVLPECRGRGVGNALLVQILREAKASGYPAVSLSVDPDNPAIFLYNRHGFAVVGKRGTSVVMKTKL